MTINAAGQLIKKTTPSDQEILYDYFPNGKLKERSFDGKIEKYLWDSRNLLVRISSPDYEESYQYDAAERKTKIINETIGQNVSIRYDEDGLRVSLSNSPESDNSVFQGQSESHCGSSNGRKSGGFYQRRFGSKNCDGEVKRDT